jgi:FMN-dependent NADH-azoreductase
MKTLLHLDASARPGRSDLHAHGSHTRRLTARFAAAWHARRPDDRIVYRDIGHAPPRPVSGRWIEAAFTPPQRRTPAQQQVLAESDALVDELMAADLIVAGVPMYNFGPPAGFKAYIDNIVRVGRTFGFDRQRDGDPYWPMLAGMGKRLVLLSSRGDFGYGPGERLAHANHVEASVRTAFAYIGITEADSVAVEYDEFGGERLAASLRAAEASVDRLVEQLVGRLAAAQHEPATLLPA